MRRDDYKFEESNSISNTYDDVKAPTVVEVTHEPLQKMLSLENLNLIPPEDMIFSLLRYEEEKEQNNSSSILVHNNITIIQNNN